MKKYLTRLASAGRGWLLVLWIYACVCWHFWIWRLHFWQRRNHFKGSNDTTMKQTLLLIRHGQTAWNVEHRLPGQLPGVALNDVGRQQVARLADALSVLPISAIISSPLERARDTAEIIAQCRNLSVQLEPHLMDTAIGRWAGHNYEELNKTDPEWKAYVRDPTVAPAADIETFPQVQQRAVAAVERWRTLETSGAYPAFVAHADVVKLLLAHYTGLEAGRAGSLFIDNASVSLVELEPEHHPRVVAMGWNPRPGWLKLPLPEPEAAKQAEADQPRGIVQ